MDVKEALTILKTKCSNRDANCDGCYANEDQMGACIFDCFGIPAGWDIDERVNLINWMAKDE